MRISPVVFSLFLLGTVATTGPAAAQVRASLRAGVTWSSTLLDDEIVNPIKLETGLAPTLVAGASLPVGLKYRLGLEARLTTSSLTAKENGQETDLGGLRTASLQLVGEGPAMVRRVRWRAGVGFLKYLPAEKTGVFADGGPARLMGSFSAEYHREFRPGWEGTAGLDYAYHRFTTEALKARGFSQTQDVHRVSLSVGVSRSF
ncbi:MAG: hypothetical protein AB7I33_07985 [Gemmatimonadales bacterium]